MPVRGSFENLWFERTASETGAATYEGRVAALIAVRNLLNLQLVHEVTLATGEPAEPDRSSDDTVTLLTAALEIVDEAVGVLDRLATEERNYENEAVGDLDRLATEEHNLGSGNENEAVGVLDRLATEERNLGSGNESLSDVSSQHASTSPTLQGNCAPWIPPAAGGGGIYASPSSSSDSDLL